MGLTLWLARKCGYEQEINSKPFRKELYQFFHWNREVNFGSNSLGDHDYLHDIHDVTAKINADNEYIVTIKTTRPGYIIGAKGWLITQIQLYMQAQFPDKVLKIHIEETRLWAELWRD
jgi:hypothetical protein